MDTSCPPTQPYGGSSNLPPARHWHAHPCPPCIAIPPQFAADDLLTLQNVDSSLRTMTAHMSNPFEHSISSTDLNTSSELRTLHSVKYMLHLRDGVHTYVPEPLTAPQLVVPHGQRGSTLTHTMHHDGLPVPTGKSKPPTGKGGRSNPLTQTDNHMHHTSISIVILGKHIATMLRHNPYSLLHSTARTNLVERSYSQLFFFFFALSFGFFISCLTLCFSFPSRCEPHAAPITKIYCNPG